MTTPRTPLRRAQALLALSLGVSALTLAGPCVADDASPVRAYYYFVHWMSMGRTDLALGQFADDAVVVAGPACTSSRPCVGKAAIREGYLGALKTGRLALPVQDQRFDGQQLLTRGETVLPDGLHGRVVHLRSTSVFEFRDGRIASLRAELDSTDTVTAAFVARQAPAVVRRR